MFCGFVFVETYGDLLANGKLLLPLNVIPKFFINRIQEAAHFFCNYQMKIMMRNIRYFPCDTRVYEIMMKPAQKLAANKWIEKFAVHPMDPKDRLFNGEVRIYL